MKYEQSNHDKSANRITPDLTSNSIPNPQNLALNFDTPLPSKERENVENVNINTEMSANFDYSDGVRNETRQEEDEMMIEGIRIKEEGMDENFDYGDGVRNEMRQEEDEMMIEGIRMKEESMDEYFDYDDGMRNEMGQEEDEMMVEGIRIKEKRMDEEDEEVFMENENKDELHIQVTGKMFSQVATNQLCNFPKVRLSETPQAAIGPKL